MANLPGEPQVASPKEQKEILSRLFPEKHPIVERPTVPEVPPEIERFEAIAGAEIQLPTPVTDDTGQVLVTSPAAAKPKIVLPLTEEEIERGLHTKIIYSLRWLAEWCTRLIKTLHGRVVYRKVKSYES